MSRKLFSRSSSKGVNHIAALEHLSHRIINTEDKLLFREAIGSARSGAFRAAYIMTWLAAAESLKRKFREIAVRDAAAQRVVGEIQQREAAHQSIDMYLLTQSRGYGLITDAEHQKLEAIYSGRCLYGHPYEQQPSSAALVAAATDVIESILSKPTRLRHGYLSQQIDSLVRLRGFLDDREPSVKAFAAEIIEKCDEGLYLWFLQDYWKRVAPLFSDPSNEVEQRRAIWLSAAIVERLYKQLEGNWDVITDLTTYPKMLAEILAVPRVFGQISDHAKQIVVSNLLASADTSSKSLLPLEQLDDKHLLDAQQKTKFLEGLAQLPLLILAQSGIKASYFVHRIIAELKSYTWPRQNTAILVIKNIGLNQVGSLAAETQRELGANVLQAAEGSSKEAGRFVNEVGRATIPWPSAFIEGMVSECFINDREEIRFKNEDVANAIKAVGTLPLDKQLEIVERLAGRIEHGSLKTYISPEKRVAAISVVKQNLEASLSTRLILALTISTDAPIAQERVERRRRVTPRQPSDETH